MRRVVPIILLAALSATLGYVVFVRSHQEPGITGPVLTARFMDADLGNAVVLTTPEGNVIVVDPPKGQAGNDLAQWLSHKRVRNVSVIFPNREDKQTTKIIETAARVKQIICREADASAESWEPQVSGKPTVSTSRIAVARGDRLKLSPTVRLEVLSPARGAEQDVSDGSLVFRVQFGEKSILFTSDIGQEDAVALIKSGQSLTSSIFVASKSGLYGNSLELLSMVRPETIIIPGPRRPSSRLMNRLSPRNTGAALYRTDSDGIIEAKTNGRSIQVATAGGER